MFLFAKQTNPNQSKQEVSGTVILPPLVFPASRISPVRYRGTGVKGSSHWQAGMGKIEKVGDLKSQNLNIENRSRNTGIE